MNRIKKIGITILFGLAMFLVGIYTERTVNDCDVETIRWVVASVSALIFLILSQEK